jgi:hypothetical protein
MNKQDHRPWIGFDLDGTLAHYDRWRGVEHIGAPLPAMCQRAKTLASYGFVIKIVTARVGAAFPEQIEPAKTAIALWCAAHLGFIPEVTAAKDQMMMHLFDDRAIQCVPNVGKTVREHLDDIVTTHTTGLRGEHPSASLILDHIRQLSQALIRQEPM